MTDEPMVERLEPGEWLFTFVMERERAGSAEHLWKYLSPEQKAKWADADPCTALLSQLREQRERAEVQAQTIARLQDGSAVHSLYRQQRRRTEAAAERTVREQREVIEVGRRMMVDAVPGEYRSGTPGVLIPKHTFQRLRDALAALAPDTEGECDV